MMKTQPRNNNIEVSFEKSNGDEYFTKIANNYKDVCEILFATDFTHEVCKHFRFVHSMEVDYLIKMRIGKITLKQKVSQNVVFNTELLREMFGCMQRVLISLVIDKEWKEDNQ